MADIVISIVAKVAEALVKPTLRQGQYLFCVNKVIRNLDDEKKKLISKGDSILTRVQQAKERTEIIEDAVGNWLDDVKNLLDEVEQLERDVRESHCFQGWCPTRRTYRLCKKISKRPKKISDLIATSNFEPFSHPAPLPGIEYNTSQNFTYFESTKVAYNQLLEALKDDNVHMIGLYGMGGSGKTTLATEVGEKAKSEMNLFNHVILVTVSHEPKIRGIQGQMADLLKLKLEEESEEGRARRLCLRLREEKSVLMIVDDVWAEFDLKEIGIRLEDNKKPNFKVLLTTRQRQVCDLMNCQKAILLDLLTDNEAWSLFRKNAGIGDGSSSNHLKLAREVSDQCRGLPIAIEAVGSSLKGKGNAEWQVALESLRHSEPFDDHEEEVMRHAFASLKLSYDYLENKAAKTLFLMCSMFPEDHEISIEDLIRYGVGLGVCGNRKSFNSARNHIIVGINKLVDSCLLLRSRQQEHHVKMYDVVRDVALCIASKVEDYKILVNLANDQNAFAISSWSEKTNLISYQMDSPRLEILLLQTQNKNSLDFSFASSDGVKELKVISILNSYLDYRKPLLLFQSTPYLTNLRTLRLSRWKLGDLSFIISLTRLEALDLRNCHFMELPKGLEKLNKLKLLDLSGCKLLENFNYEVLASFSQLEELYVGPWRFPSEVIKDIVTLPNLQRFWISECLYKINDGENTRVLELHDFNISDFSASKQNLLQRAEHVSLQGVRGGCKNVIPNMVRVVGGMNELTNLCFHSCLEIECLIDTTYLHAGSFQVDTSLPKLVKLELSEMDNLKEVCRGAPLLVLGFFEKLEQLFIRHCPQLHSIFPEASNLCNLKILKIGNYDYRLFEDCAAVVSLFSVSVAQSLQQLEELSINGCKELKHIITSEAEGGTNTGDNSHLMFPNLKKISVSYCHKLEFIFPISFALQGLLQLQKIKISHAFELKYVFFQHDYEASHQNQIQIMLAQLKVFELHYVENLLAICPKNYHLRYPSLVKLSYESFPKLTTSYINAIISSTQRQQYLNMGVALDEDQQNHLTSNLQQLELQELPELKFIWSGSAPRQVLSFQFLQLLKLDHCSNLKSVFSIAIERSLPELTSLSIYRCDELEEIMAENEEPQNLSSTEVCFPKLSGLVIKKCDKWKSLFSIAMVEMSPQLSTLRISEAAQLEVVFRHSSEYNTDNRVPIMLPSLKNLELKKLPSFVNIFEGSNFQAPKLQKLSTYECPKFAPILRGTQVISLPHTEERHVFCLISSTWSELCRTRSSAASEAFLELEVLRETKSKEQVIFHIQVKTKESNIEWKSLYSNLRKLQLRDLLELRFIWKVLPQYLSLEKLREILLVDCPKLKTIFSSDIVKCFPNLRELSISNCEELEEIISSDSENAQFKPSSSRPKQEVCFPRLYSIKVKQCNRLKWLFYDSKACHFPELQLFTIEECSQLEQIFGFKIEAGDKSFQREASEDGHLILFPKLRDLTVMDCPKYRLTSRESSTSCQHVTTQEGQVFWLITTSSSLQAFLNLEELHLTENRAEGIFQLQVEGETSNNSEWKPWKSNLLGLELCNLPELRFIWNGFSKYLSLENFVGISLHECPKLKTIFSSNIVRYLPNLWSLSISNCEELEEIISSDSERTQLGLPSSCPQQEVFFPQLYKIEVKQCNKLKCLFYDSNICHFSKLKFLAIEECSQLEFGFKIEAGDTSLQRELSEDEDLIWLPKLRLTVMNCPKYSLTSNESRTSCLHNIAQKEQVFWLITASSSLQAFLNLKELHLTKSREECIFQLQVEGESSSNNEWTPLNSSLWYLRLHDLPELRFIWKDFSKFLSLEELTEVSLVDCPQLKTIFSPYIVRCLPELKRLLISNCEKLEEIMSSDLENAQLRHPTACPPQEVCFPWLIKIEVKQCNKLKCLFYDSMAYHFPKLKSLEIEECSQIEQVFGSKGTADDESSQRWANEDGDRILLPKLRKLVFRSLPIFFEISRGFNLSQPMHKYLVTDCPKYNSTFDEANTSYQHTTTQGEHSDEESQESSDEEEYSDEEFFDGA